MMNKKPVCLVIRDGWGRGRRDKTDGIFSANTPHTDELERKWPTTLIKCSGEAVGLPPGFQGNSEVGHLNIGAGRVVYQALMRINRSIDDGSLFENEVLVDAVQKAKQRNVRVHLLGLIQQEGVHALTSHGAALLELCKKLGHDNVVIHAITDGRDTPPKSAMEHMSLLQKYVDEVGIGTVGTVIGRYYAMDRDRRWDRTALAYRAIMKAEGKRVSSWREAIEEAYANDETDEFITPCILDGYEPAGKDDVMIFFNFRFDRTRQLTKAIVEPDFNEFERIPNNIDFVAMTHYYDNGNFREAFPELENRNNLGEVLSSNGLTQLRSAETEKYAHVTFFFNSLRNDPFPNEERILVDSPRVKTYDLKPEMSAYEVRDRLVEAVNSEKYDVIICNFANGDMVGHTGVYDAIIKAVEAVDTCVHDVVEAVLAHDGVCLLTADHGNAEQTKLDDSSPMTAHTKNDVPFTVAGLEGISLHGDGKLADIAPTMLHILGVEKPEEMTGKSLIK